MRRVAVLAIFFSLLALALTTIVVDTVPTTIDDFFLPGSQPGESGNLESPSKCDNCHGGYDNDVEPDFLWKGNMMSQAARDPLFYATMAIANQDAPESGDLCLRCHTPKGWLEGRSVPTDGSGLSDADLNGVTCDFCHKMVRPTEIGVNPYPDDSIYTTDTYQLDQDYLLTIDTIPGFIGNGMYVADVSNAKRGPYSDADATHQFIYSPFHKSSALCGTCHDVSNPAFDAVFDSNGIAIDYVPNAWGTPAATANPHGQLPVERTYSEWLMSAFNSPEGVSGTPFGGNLSAVSSCQDCHMRDTTGYGCNKNPPLRDDLPMHDLTGGNTFIPLLVMDLYENDVDPDALNAGILRARYMLRNAAEMVVAIDEGTRSFEVEVTNQTGHKLPTGYPEGRRMWLEVKAWSASGEYYESGAYDDSTAVLTHDADAKIYEVKPGISPWLASVTGIAAGPSFHFVLNDTVYKDNRIPPMGFTNTGFDSVQASPVGYSYSDGQHWDSTLYETGFIDSIISVEVSLLYQTTSKEYVTFLRDENLTNDWGDVMFDLWEQYGKSPPEVMEYFQWGAPVIDLDEDGFIAAVDCDDNDPDVYPGAAELPDCVDNNCDGYVDERMMEDGLWVWTGCANSDSLTQGSNWDRGTPFENGMRMLVPDSIGGAFFPTISDSTSAESVIVQNGASLEVAPGGVMNIINTASSYGLHVEGVFFGYGEISIASVSEIPVYVGSLALYEIQGVMNVSGDTLLIENYGNFEIGDNGLLQLSGSGNPKVTNYPGAILNIEGSVNVFRN